MKSRQVSLLLGMICLLGCAAVSQADTIGNLHPGASLASVAIPFASASSEDLVQTLVGLTSFDDAKSQMLNEIPGLFLSAAVQQWIQVQPELNGDKFIWIGTDMAETASFAAMCSNGCGGEYSTQLAREF